MVDIALSALPCAPSSSAAASASADASVSVAVSVESCAAASVDAEPSAISPGSRHSHLFQQPLRVRSSPPFSSVDDPPPWMHPMVFFQESSSACWEMSE